MSMRRCTCAASTAADVCLGPTGAASHTHPKSPLVTLTLSQVRAMTCCNFSTKLIKSLLHKVQFLELSPARIRPLLGHFRPQQISWILFRSVMANERALAAISVNVINVPAFVA